MFSNGQLIFAVLFALSFIVIITYSYKKEKKIYKKNYKGVKWVGVSFAIFIIILFFIKHIIKN